MNWHLHRRAKGLIVSGVLILALIGLPMGFALNRTGDEMKQDVSIMTCNIGEIVGSKPLDSDQVAAFIRDCGVPVSRDYFKGTYTKLDFPIAPRIDFLFVSAALGRKNARVIPKSPGDHFPVWADILIPGQGLGVQACFIVVIGGGILWVLLRLPKGIVEGIIMK